MNQNKKIIVAKMIPMVLTVFNYLAHSSSQMRLLSYAPRWVSPESISPYAGKALHRVSMHSVGQTPSPMPVITESQCKSRTSPTYFSTASALAIQVDERQAARGRLEGLVRRGLD